MKLKRNSRPPELAKGQIWKIGEAHLEITHLGKRLTEYKRYRDITKRRAGPEMGHIVEVQQILVSHQAALVQRPRARRSADRRVRVFHARRCTGSRSS